MAVSGSARIALTRLPGKIRMTVSPMMKLPSPRLRLESQTRNWKSKFKRIKALHIATRQGRRRTPVAGSQIAPPWRLQMNRGTFPQLEVHRDIKVTRESNPKEAAP